MSRLSKPCGIPTSHNPIGFHGILRAWLYFPLIFAGPSWKFSFQRYGWLRRLDMYDTNNITRFLRITCAWCLSGKQFHQLAWLTIIPLPPSLKHTHTYIVSPLEIFSIGFVSWRWLAKWPYVHLAVTFITMLWYWWKYFLLLCCNIFLSDCYSGRIITWPTLVLFPCWFLLLMTYRDTCWLQQCCTSAMVEPRLKTKASIQSWHSCFGIPLRRLRIFVVSFSTSKQMLGQSLKLDDNGLLT